MPTDVVVESSMPHQKIHMAVSSSDDRVVREQDGVGPALGPGQLCKDNSCHAAGDDDADNALNGDNDDGFRTFFSDLTRTVPKKEIIEKKNIRFVSFTEGFFLGTF